MARIKPAGKRISRPQASQCEGAANDCGSVARENQLRHQSATRRKMIERAILLAGNAHYPSSAVMNGVALVLAGGILASIRQN